MLVHYICTIYVQCIMMQCTTDHGLIHELCQAGQGSSVPFMNPMFLQCLGWEFCDCRYQNLWLRLDNTYVCNPDIPLVMS